MTTHQQEAALDAIRRLTVDGVPPSYEELRVELGLGSKSGIHRMVGELERDGRIVRTGRQYRSIVIVDDAVHPSVLNAASTLALRNTLAFIAGILAAREGGFETATTLRRVADGLLRPGER